ncbi:hypothetical protein MRX96_041814 [Rhipicephalus microplus]
MCARASDGIFEQGNFHVMEEDDGERKKKAYVLRLSKLHLPMTDSAPSVGSLLGSMRFVRFWGVGTNTMRCVDDAVVSCWAGAKM